MNDALKKLHDFGVIHGDISPNNIVLQGVTPILIDWEMLTKIGDVGHFKGTLGYCSLALDKAHEEKSSHRYKRRDDFESLFLVLLFWLNKKANLWRQKTEKKTIIFDSWKETKAQIQQNNSGIDIELIQRLRDNLYKDYNLLDNESANEMIDLFKN